MPKRGENIYKRKDGRWEGRYIRERNNGVIKYGYIYAPTYREVKERLQHTFITSEIPERKISNIDSEIKAPDYAFEEIVTEWMHAIQSNIKETSYVKYNNILRNHLLPKYAGCILSEITNDDITQFIRELLLTSGKEGCGLSPKTVADIISLLKNIFRYAATKEGCIVPDLKNISIKQNFKPMRILSLSEQQRLLSYLQNNLSAVNLGIIICLFTGLRIGEICALKWIDISFEEQCISVNKTMQRIQCNDNHNCKTKILISSPKSNCSMRKIPIPYELFELLRNERKADNAYLLSGVQDSFIEPRTMQNRFKQALKECFIKNANFHSLRHTFATRCIELGFDVKSLSEILGHASVNITMNRYVHPSMELKQKNMDKLSDLFAVK